MTRCNVKNGDVRTAIDLSESYGTMRARSSRQRGYQPQRDALRGGDPRRLRWCPQGLAVEIQGESAGIQIRSVDIDPFALFPGIVMSSVLVHSTTPSKLNSA